MDHFKFYKISFSHLLFALIIFTLVNSSLLVTKGQSEIASSDTLTALFIGNSITGFNQMPKSVENLGLAAGKNIFCDSKIIFGTSVVDIWGFPDTKEKILERNWDYLVIQGDIHSSAFPDNHHEIMPWLPYKPIKPMLQQIKEFLEENQLETQLIFFMPWAYEDGMTWVPGQTDTYETMQQKIYENSVMFADDLQIPVAPVGWAWNKVWNENYELKLFMTDYIHPNAEGSYLAACVFYCSFYREQVEENSYLVNIDPSDATYLQNVASSIVNDNLELWNLVTTSSISKLNNVPASFNLNQNYPNPFNPTTKISFQLPFEGNTTLKVYNVLGNEVVILLDQNLSAGFYEFDFNADNLPSGTYFYQLRHKNGIKTMKMTILK